MKEDNEDKLERFYQRVELVMFYFSVLYVLFLVVYLVCVYLEQHGYI